MENARRNPVAPSAWQEQEKYISELENQDRVPEGKEVVHPIAGFVMKTKFHRGSKDLDREKVGTDCGCLHAPRARRPPPRLTQSPYSFLAGLESACPSLALRLVSSRFFLSFFPSPPHGQFCIYIICVYMYEMHFFGTSVSFYPPAAGHAGEARVHY